MRFKIDVLFLILLLFMLGCASKKEKPKPSELNIYNWEDYIGSNTISGFQEKYNIKVNLKTFEDEDVVSSELQSLPSIYDLVVVSDTLVRDLSAMRLLAEVNKDNIPNIKNLDNSFLDLPYDKGNHYSIPYLWGTTGIAINKKYIDNETNSWNVLWDKAYKGKIAMLNNADEVIGAAAKKLGYSLNISETDKLDNVGKELIKQNPLILGYMDVLDIQQKLLKEELWAAQIYSGEGVAAMDENQDLEYFIPKEGAARWIDSFVIPREAKNKYAAELFINHVLDAYVSASIANELWYANCNQAAILFTDEAILRSKSLYPDEIVLSRCEFFFPGGVRSKLNAIQRLKNSIWAKLMSMQKEKQK